MQRFVQLLLVLFLFGSCGDNREKLFEMQFEADFTTPASLDDIQSHFFPIQNVQTFYSTFKGNIADVSIDAIHSSSCVVQGIFSNFNYDFVRDISVFVIDPLDNTNRRELFYLEPNPVDGNSNLELFANISDFKEDLAKDLIHLEVRMRFRTLTPANLDHRVILRFDAFAEE